MAVKQVLLKNGQVLVEEVPAPGVSPKNVLVRVDYSCISVGTELAGLKQSSYSIYKLALKHPQLVWTAYESVRDEGIKRTWEKIRGQTAAGAPIGYTASGEVVEVGAEVAGFQVGDRVACAGAGIANHAEWIDVPVNLAVKIPEGLEPKFAATVALGSIAMQSVRRASLTMGETVAVIGLGSIGQLVCQLLKNQGCRVIGTDLDSNRIQTALDHGMDRGVDLSQDDLQSCVSRFTEGFGADAVIVTASSQGHEVMQQAFQVCRKKGRVVIVGDVGLNLNRADFYAKEIDVLISTSYGPGRYDPIYEQEGCDYPLPYIRWTENRNMEEYLRLLAEKRISLDELSLAEFEVDRAQEAYNAINQPENKPLFVLLSYPSRPEAIARTVSLKTAPVSDGRIRVALVGAGAFAKSVLLPNLKKLNQSYDLRCVMSQTGSNAKTVASQYNAALATTDFDAILNDDNIDLVLIVTRHHLHGPLVLQALQAGKNVFVEKPLCLTQGELDAIEAYYVDHPDAPLLMTGFNRRFSPAVQRISEIIQTSSTPLVANYRMNAGYIPTEHWVHGPEGGGRNIGEACHIYDLFNGLTDAEISNIHASSIRPRSRQWKLNDNFIATIAYADGSVCSLTYTALGHSAYPKERLEVFTDGKVIFLDNYQSLSVSGSKQSGWKSSQIQKGHFEEFQVLAECLKKQADWPISLQQQLQATRMSFEIERMLYQPSSTTDNSEGR